jgi:hypothetical protein
MPHSANSLLKALSGSVSPSYCASSLSRFGAGAGAGRGRRRHGRRGDRRGRCAALQETGQQQRDTRDRDHADGRTCGPGQPERLDRLAEHLTGRAPDDVAGHHVPVLGEGAQQGAVADDVDQARHATRQSPHLAQGAVREHFLRGTGDAQAVTHVGRGLVAGERIEVVTTGDALRELPQLGAVQHLAQLGLADQDDLQQLLGLGLEVGQQAHLLEHVGREVLRFVDHQHHASALGVCLQQAETEQVDQVLEAALGARLHRDAQLLADGQQEFCGGHARVQDQRDLGVLGGLGQQRAHHRGLAGADFTGQLDEAARLVDAVHQVRQGLRMPFREEQVARIGRDRKGLFVQSEKRGVHGYLRSVDAALN